MPEPLEATLFRDREMLELAANSRGRVELAAYSNGRLEQCQMLGRYVGVQIDHAVTELLEDGWDCPAGITKGTTIMAKQAEKRDKKFLSVKEKAEIEAAISKVRDQVVAESNLKPGLSFWLSRKATAHSVDVTKTGKWKGEWNVRISQSVLVAEGKATVQGALDVFHVLLQQLIEQETGAEATPAAA